VTTPDDKSRTSLAWFFGYGSLMWNPGFTHDAFEPAELQGYHRSLCITSRHYRGTAERPGLVLGLAPGGHCVGRAIGVAHEREPEVLAYLDARENVRGIYIYERLRLPLKLLRCESEIEAWCYVACTDHPDFAGNLSEEEVLARVQRAIGLAGTNADYVRNTVTHLADIGIREPSLEALAASASAEGT
jgi:glutathione-specific gamma-glutamylcyclotransferase